MSEQPDTWWRAPPEMADEVARNRAAFVEQFGDFAAVQCVGFWIGTAPDGRFLGLQFDRLDGTVERIALRFDLSEKFVMELFGALEALGANLLREAKPAGAA